MFLTYRWRLSPAHSVPKSDGLNINKNCALLHLFQSTWPTYSIAREFSLAGDQSPTKVGRWTPCRASVAGDAGSRIGVWTRLGTLKKYDTPRDIIFIRTANWSSKKEWIICPWWSFLIEKLLGEFSFQWHPCNLWRPQTWRNCFNFRSSSHLSKNCPGWSAKLLHHFYS
jgi:hypothetical protein